MPSVGLRLAGEAALLVLVALGLALAGFDPIVIGVVMFVALIFVALLERASAKEAARAGEGDETEQPQMPPPHVERTDVEPAAGAESQVPAGDREPKLEAAVDERSARAILASATPPPPSKPKAKPRHARAAAERRPERRRAAPPPPTPRPEPEPEAVFTGSSREWNLWELQRAVRDSSEEERREEWSALLIHLREFANADGDLPPEFDRLVRESFGVLLAAQREPAAAP